MRMSRSAQKLRDEDINPCLKETDGSKKCLEANNYNRDLCTYHFLRYKMCRKFWNNIMIERRKNGIIPNMPTAEERRTILEEYKAIPY
ncbi:coiled-coil-helix-coiled-coil-helix domain-containing protein 7 [Callorhinchus milii]|uniref:Coiled-coil-helix-coiled-coil-helix domain-containing protein 7 n=1 Tax=Callorhinchus milii TaxID=7868 RepID=K4FY98_CALMI|nr:coiled-coil-helix-coiled-coil-helix domain-containing protein 7 [Callorhinchus milii]XP_007889198.1 coiled-coil-helix-coiled-coil-helix domain-containing protein 7 [Callorhinchus milii]XP_007889199.1 coiled-coil-helix-coiled-coil-helix domain-containing protein 7 [Callorhinchus milii]XP_007889200.1 coiled-coil-helix-coiled-coil-helix domain-containing protein 7 [Callorhinchus milii]AFK11107.1 coiled-coil-helix-coiled-coil-helix domain-containing protein 7-like protein [Callorhinchus milii]|eukprot:gi/632947733/ref/XP_007889197.1/ PREDICTED: coiled-coil-helix-coiled-coil-helix domain-containing protein 7 [Callorhinchus milii]